MTYLRWVKRALIVSRTDGPTLASIAREVNISDSTVAIPHLTYTKIDNVVNISYVYRLMILTTFWIDR